MLLPLVASKAFLNLLSSVFCQSNHGRRINIHNSQAESLAEEWLNSIP